MLDGGSGVGGVRGREGSRMGCSCRMGKSRAKDRWPAGGRRREDAVPRTQHSTVSLVPFSSSFSASRSRAGEEARDMGP